MAIKNSNQFFRPLLGQALKISWTNKFLWFFAFLTVLITGGGQYNFTLRFFDQTISILGALTSPRWETFKALAGGWLGQLELIFTGQPFLIILLILIGLALFVVALWLIFSSQIALIASPYYTIKGKTSGLKSNFKQGIIYFFPLLGFNLIIKAALFVLLGLISVIPFIVLPVSQNALAALIFYLGFFLLFVPLAVISWVATKFMVAYLAIKGQKFWPAIKQSFGLFFSNWLLCLELLVLLAIINLGVWAASTILLVLVGVPFFLLFLLFANFISYIGSLIIAGLGVGVIIVLLAVLGLVLVTFQWASWSLLFIFLTEKKRRISRLVYWAQTLTNRWKSGRKISG